MLEHHTKIKIVSLKVKQLFCLKFNDFFLVMKCFIFLFLNVGSIFVDKIESYTEN
jgi:hypothetical protein